MEIFIANIFAYASTIIITDFIMSSCNICNRRVLKHAYQLKCCVCHSLVHIKCLPRVTKTDSIYIERESNNWSCTKCNQSIFPFNHFYDDDDFFSAVYDQLSFQPSVSFDSLVNNELLFLPFDVNGIVYQIYHKYIGLCGNQIGQSGI